MIEVEDYIDLRKKLADLECAQPSGVAILPEGIEQASNKDDLYYTLEAVTLSKLLIQRGVEVGKVYEDDQEPELRTYNSYTWLLPTVLITAPFLVQNPEAISDILTAFQSFCTTAFRSTNREMNVKLEFIEERKQSSSYRKITYTGPVSGMQEITEIVGSDDSDE